MSDARGIRTVPWILLALVLAVPCSTEAGGVWQSGGPLDAKRQDVFAMAVDPTTAGTVYAGTYDSGIYKSTDGGLTWLPASLGLASQGVNALAVAPSDPQTVYAGGNGVSRSRDGGASWVRTGLVGQYVSAVAVDPVDPARLFAGTLGGGVFLSLDAGNTWTSVNAGMTNLQVNALAIDPTSPATVYAGTMGGLFKTASSGSAWTGLDPSSVRALVLDPSAPATVYAATTAGVLRSTNAGASWSPLNNGLTSLDVYSMAIDRTAPATLYVGTYGGGVFKSTVAGAAWTPVGLGLGVAGFVYSLAIDTQAHDLVYAGTDTRLFRTTDGASTWSGASPGFGRVDIYALAIDPLTAGTVYAAASDTGPGFGVGVYKSTDRGGTWTAANAGLAGVDLRALAIDPVTPTTVYAGGNTFFKSVNGGASWAASGNGLPAGGFVQCLAVDRQSPATIYAGTWPGVYKSTDRGATWSAANTGLPPAETEALAIDPLTPAVLYAAIRNAGVFKSTNGGGTWTAANNGLPNQPVWAIAVDPATPSTLYVVTNAVFKSTDSAASWVSVSTGLLAGVFPFSLAISPASPTTVYVGAYPSFGGIFTSKDGGATWAGDPSGLPVPGILTLAVDPTGTTLYAGTIGGVWQLRSTTGAFHTVSPCRVVDTRGSDSPALGAGLTRSFKLIGKCGIPAEASSVSLNVTVTGALSAGHLRLYPGTSPRPSSSSLNFAAGETRANDAVALLGPAGDLEVFAAQAVGGVDVIVDVTGYFR
jgi:hypothetical protein